MVAVSGGADSVALLRLLILLGYRVEAVHCNFHLRGKESDRDEAFVRQLCLQLSVPFHLAHFDTTVYASLHKVSIEMAARDLRYHYFFQLCQDLQAKGICIAHHQDDNAETLLLNIIRGTGIHGLTGMKPMRLYEQSFADGTTSSIQVIRPLLCVSRQQIEEWLTTLHQSYITDSSNLHDDVTRNKIRLNILPLLKDINPKIVDNLVLTAHLMQETESIYEQFIQTEQQNIIKGNSVELNSIKDSKAPLSLLYEWLKTAGFNSAMVQQILQHINAPTGSLWHSATHTLCIDRHRIVLSEKKPSISPMHLPEPGTYILSNGSKIRIVSTTDVQIDKSCNIACLDADLVEFPLTLRTVQTGDRFIPFGMKGSKLVSDYLTDLKVPITEKHVQLVLTDSHNQIIWIVNRRVANPAAVTSDTSNLLKIEFLNS